MTQQEARDTRGLILATAREMFSTQTYRAASVRAIAEQVGITKPSLYHHFRNKAEILECLISDPLNELEKVVEDAAAASSPSEIRRTLLQGCIAVLTEHRDVMGLLFRDASVYTNETTDLVSRTLGITERATELLTGPDPDWRMRLRAYQAFAAATDPIAHFADAPQDELREELLLGAYTLLGLEAEPPA
ncbi:TetR family transcriptional regulator [Tamaricihabitans halophyticus]|uniref:TetR family transcriptional regulator n=1 Tax=Tamaricihabitans halophyticus TaxID=1262583 RepID=A0A4R2QA62_9PSEU|nr:TetR/AcrR family transcriptional regulator [Tamaricihabitans halophyticus]TCP45820.1 TetR family transcriptional regulator [Tamaricihabitans halophyticus]